MKSKRFLAMLVALCLVIGAFAPSAAAAHKHGIVPGTSSGANWDNDRLVSNADKTGINSLRGEDGLLSKNADGKWVINASKLNLWETIGGGLFVLAFAAVLIILCIRADQKIKAEYALTGRK